MYKFNNEKTDFDKPIHLDLIILELPKLLLYEFFYKRLEPIWQNKVHLHYMETDTFVLNLMQTTKN